MPFEKGHNKTGGRKKGVENTDKRKIREAINTLLDDTDIKALYDEQATPKDKASLLLGLLEFSIPKLQRSDINLNPDNEEDDLSNYTTEELIKRADAIRKLSNE